MLSVALALLLAAPPGTPQSVGWAYAARTRDDKRTQHVVTGTPLPDLKSFLRTGTVSLRCTDKDPHLEAAYVSGTPSDGGPLAFALDGGDPVLYDVDWYTNLSARLPAARLLAALESARSLTIAVSGSPEHYDLRSLGPALAELRKHCQFPAPPASRAGANATAGSWSARGLVTAKGEEGVVLSLKGDNGVASLRLRCKGSDADVYLAVDSGGLSSRSQPVALQLDQGATLKVSGSTGTDGKALYLAKPRDQLRSLLGHGRLNVAFAGPLGAPVVDSFDLTGVDETLAPWSGACGLTK
jgi:hypothetical protein